MFNASAVINLHREGLTAVPTFRSLANARDDAAKAGFAVEFVAILDNADEETRRVVKANASLFDQVHNVGFGDLGESRAFGINAASADWVFMHDADDLFSTNWFTAFLTMQRDGKADPRTVYHTDLFARFGEEIDVRKMINSTDPRFHPLFMASEWYFSNKAVFHRGLLDDFPMPFNNRRTGIGNEDWTWASHTLAGGIRHLTVPGTVCFYRAKDMTVSLGLTPGMIHDASPLYSPDSVIALALKQAKNQQQQRNFNPVLAGRADGVVGEGAISHWFWDEVLVQSAFESEISEFLAHRYTMQCYLPHLHYNVVSAVEYMMRDMDERPKIFIFASAENMRAPDMQIDLLLRSAAAYDSEAYQPVLILDEGPLVPSDLRALASYGAKVIAVEHLRRYFKLEDWYFHRLLMRPIVQYKGSILLDCCANCFSELFARFHRVLIENFAQLVTFVPDNRVDLLSITTQNLFENAKAFVAHCNAPMPVLCRNGLLNFLSQSPQINAQPLAEPDEAAVNLATAQRYKNGNVAAPMLSFERVLAQTGDEVGALPEHANPAPVVCTPITVNGITFYNYTTAQSWVDRAWSDVAAKFLANNAHLHICAPQISLARTKEGRPSARWHNYSNPANNFAATYEQVLAGMNVPIVAMLRAELPPEALESTEALARALHMLCHANPDCKASAHGESIAIFAAEPSQNAPVAINPPMADADIYWHSYEDLAALFARGIWNHDDLRKHFREHGRGEGRRIPTQAEAPEYWSDRLYFEGMNDGYRWWWERGVMETGMWRAIVAPDMVTSHGDLPQNERLQRASAMHPGALRLVAEFDNAHPSEGYLQQIYAGKLEWREHRPTGLLRLLDAAADAVKTDDVILVPSLESGGAELVGLWHYRAAKAAGRQPLIIITDKNVITPRFEAEQMHILNLPQIYDDGQEGAYTRLSVDQRAMLLTELLVALHPQTLQLIHAYTGYTALKRPALAPRIRAACRRIYVSTFCPHIHPDGRKDGYFRDIPTIAKHVDQFVFDNHWYADEMRSTYALSDQQIRVVYYPVEMNEAPVARPAKGKNVLWASRFDAQKNPQIVGDIARKMPDVTFHLYGRAVLGDTSLDWAKMPKNVVNCGPFYGVESLPLGEVSAFLYTSRFDGMPNILLEIAARGLPIVTPLIGGIPDFLGDDWPLATRGPDDVDGYVAALEEALTQGDLREACIDKQFQRLKADRMQAAFFQSLADYYPQ